jgi:phosphoribosylformylglycinamidine synthase
MRVVLDTVPLRDPTLAPEEILMSESQERMCAVVEPAKVKRFMEICAKWDVTATVIGEVTDSHRLQIFWRDELVVDVPPRTVAHEGPVYDRPIARPADLDALNADDANALPRPSSGEELRATLLRLVGSANLADKAWITDQYDRYVLGATALAMPDDAGVLRIVDDSTDLGIALALDGNGRYARLDPYSGAQLALAEAYRNVAAAGARPMAVTDCLNFGSPEDPEVMWQFTEAIRGIADGCLALGIPVTGGNVSFYNQTGSTPINPTPVIGVLGVIDDVARRRPIAFSSDGAAIYLLGETRDEFGGSEWAHVVHGHLGGRPPRVDLDAEQALANVLISGAADELIDAAHDLSDGGLAQALVESCLRGGRGARISLPGKLSPFVELFSESSARAVVAVSPANTTAFEKLASDHGVPLSRIGVTGGGSLEVDGQFSVDVEELRATSSSVLSGLFD